MTNAEIEDGAAIALAAGVTTPQEVEQLGTRILTSKGTVANPSGGCGVGATSIDNGGPIDTGADLICANGVNTPAEFEVFATYICTRGSRTDSLKY